MAGICKSVSMLTINSMISRWLNYRFRTITVLKSLEFKVKSMTRRLFFFFFLDCFYTSRNSVLNLHWNSNCSHCPKVPYHTLSEFSNFFALHSRASLSYGTLTTVPLQVNELKGLALLWSRSNLTIWTGVTFFPEACWWWNTIHMHYIEISLKKKYPILKCNNLWTSKETLKGTWTSSSAWMHHIFSMGKIHNDTVWRDQRNRKATWTTNFRNAERVQSH